MAHQKKVLKKVLIMAGGTGGHVFPGLAVAKQLREQGVLVHWLGTPQGPEAKWVSDAGFPIDFISISGVRGKSVKNRILAPFRLAWAIMQAVRIIYKLQPDVILGMGGFVSGPGGIASWLLRRPLIIHEQNAKAGFTNKWLSYVAVKVLEAFPSTFPASAKVITTGNPVRKDIAALPSPDIRFQDREKPLRLLVIGGSLGAAAINDVMPAVLAKISSADRPLVYHQTGEKNLESTLKSYQLANIDAKVVPFIDDMRQAYEWADVVLCRSGALTIAELCAAGLGAILVPYPHAVDDHQTENANYLVKNKAALLMQQATLTEDKLTALLKQLLNSPHQRMAMAEAAYQLRQIDATDKVLKICEEVCR